MLDHDILIVGGGLTGLRAAVGLCDRFNEPTVVIYERDKVIEALKEDGMTYEEALEYFEFNIAGAGMGDLTPAFLTKVED